MPFTWGSNMCILEFEETPRLVCKGFSLLAGAKQEGGKLVTPRASPVLRILLQIPGLQSKWFSQIKTIKWPDFTFLEIYYAEGDRDLGWENTRVYLPGELRKRRSDPHHGWGDRYILLA